VPGIPADLDSRLRNAFDHCEAFESDRALRAVFRDARLYAWRNRVPENNPDRATRIAVLIDTLLDQTNTQGEHGLVLFVHVLTEDISPDDALHAELSTLATDLAREFQRSDLSLATREYNRVQRIPSILPYLVDRELQNSVLGDALEKWGYDSRRIFIYFVYGDDLQCHYKFMESVVEYALPAYLGLDWNLPIQVYRMEWPQISMVEELSKRLRQNLARAVSKNKRITASVEQINEELHKYPGPICIEMHVLVSEWREQSEAKLRGLLEFWENWPSLHSSRYPLLVFVCLKYERIQPQGFLRKRRWRHIAAVMRTIEKAPLAEFNNLACTLLPRLDDISRAEAEKWARLEENQHLCDCQILLAEIRELYRQIEALPMDSLAQHLRNILS
jgi:hypothetical protein